MVVQRETREECGLEVEPLQIAYVEDLWVPEMPICKAWFIGRVIGGELTATASGAAAEHSSTLSSFIATIFAASSYFRWC